MALACSDKFAPKLILRKVTNLASDSRGTAALEFAFVGPFLIAMLLAILYTSLVCLAQQMLETAAADAGRLLLTGQAQTATLNGHTGMTSADFKNVICNGASGTNANGDSFTIPKLLPPLLSCSQLTVNVKTAASYNVSNGAAPTYTYDSNGVLTSTGTGYNTASGGSGQSKIVILQLIYLWPTLKGTLGLNLDNQPNANRMLVATSAFTTENYSCSSSQTSC
ncbi:MAG: pilus assembly protein [Betaproteobacteria bacterium]|nr:pilus assembly protein [Betaproteobacteria bacterium]